MMREERIKKIFSLTKKDVDAIIVKNSNLNPSFFYLTGLPREFYEGAIAVAWKDGRVDVIVSRIEQTEDSELIFHTVKDSEETKKLLKQLTKDANCIGFDGIHTTVSSYRVMRRIFQKKRFYDVGRDILRARLIKSKDEIEKIKRACRIASIVADEIVDILKESITEREVADEIVYRLRRYGARREAFETIVAFGRNSAIPHYLHGEKRLKKDEIVLVDFGAVVDGYISDISRTFVYGRASERQKKMYEVVLKAQKIAIESIKEGMVFESLHKKVQRCIDKTEFRGRFIHSTGHTIGIEVHDGFSLAEGTKEKFFDGVAFTIEPGIYLKSIGGIRIEDDFVFLNGRVKRLTHAPVFLETSS